MLQGTPAPSLPPVAPPTATTSFGPPSGPPDVVLTPETEPGRPPRRVAVAAAVGAVLVLGLAALFAVSRIGRSNDGGASSPEDVGTAMMAALEQEDVLGMIDLLLPGERDALREPLIDTVSELTRIELLRSDATLADLAGLDFELSDEATEVTPTNVRDITNIRMTASMTATLDGAQLPVGDLLVERYEVDMREVYEQQTFPLELPMTVVEHDGRWYLSLGYTIAEAARSVVGDPIPERGIEPRGGATPEGAVDTLLAGVEQLDLERIIAAINPNEAAALHRYAPMFLADAQAALDELPLEWRITETEYAVDGDGAKRFIDIRSLRIEGTLDGESFSLHVAGGCATVEVAGERIDSCALQQQLDLDDVFVDAAPIERLSEEVRDALSDYEQPGITVQLVDGQWYVSPIGSAFDQMLAVLRALDRDEVERIIDRIEEAVEALFGELLRVPELVDDTVTAIDEAEVVAETVIPQGGSDEPPNEQLEAFELEQRIATECYSSGVLDDVVDCLRTNIASGALPAYYLSIELEHPECGVGEVSIGAVSLYALTDIEYTELVTTAAACFDELIEAGTVERTDVPPEYLRPQCSEGRNPWNFEAPDSEELFDRWLECVYS